MERYYAIFYPLKTGWGVRFPDVESINTGGATIEEAQTMAVDALSGMLVAGRKGREYTVPSSFEAVLSQAGDKEYVFPVTVREFFDR